MTVIEMCRRKAVTQPKKGRQPEHDSYRDTLHEGRSHDRLRDVPQGGRQTVQEMAVSKSMARKLRRRQSACTKTDIKAVCLKDVIEARRMKVVP